MAEPIFPNSVNAQGNVKLQWVETIASIAAPDLSSEIGAAGSLDVSSMLLEGGWQPGVDVNRVQAKRRISQRQTNQKFGTSTRTLADLQYQVDPQATAGSSGKKAFETLTEGSTGYIVERLGLDAVSVDWAAGQYVNVYPVELGDQNIPVDTSDEAAEFFVQQPVNIRGDVALMVQIVA